MRGLAIKPPIDPIAVQELDIHGTFRFDAQFTLAVDRMNSGRIEVKPAPAGP